MGVQHEVDAKIRATVTSGSPWLVAGQLERLRQLVQDGVSNEEGRITLLEQLGLVAPHLDDRVVCEQESPNHEGSARPLLRACVFVDRSGKRGIVTVDDHGAVAVLRLQGLADPPVTMLLGDFDRRRDRVISVTCTRRLRLVGTGVDLWIVIRRYPELSPLGEPPPVDPAVLSFHAIVGIGDGEVPFIKPSHDDSATETASDRWQPFEGVELPPWIRDFNFTSSCAGDPLDQLHAWDSLKDDLLAAEARFVAGGGDGITVWGSGDDHLTVRVGDQRLRLSTSSGDRLRAISLTRGRSWNGNATRETLQVACCGYGELAVFDLDGNPRLEGSLLSPSWKQRIHSSPRTLSFVPVERGKTDLREVVVGFRNGQLARLRVIPEGEIRDVWTAGWQVLEDSASDSDRNVSFLLAPLPGAGDPQRREGRSPSVRRALLYRLIERLVTEPGLAPPDDSHLDRCAVLITGEESSYVMAPVLKLLIRSLIQWAETPAVTDPAAAIVPRLATRVYQRCPHSVGDELDLAFRQIDTHLDSPRRRALTASHPDAVAVIARWRRDREQIWNEGPPPSHDEVSLIAYCSLGLERWANAFIQSAGVRTGDSKAHRRGGRLVVLTARGDTILVAADGTTLSAFSIADGHIKGLDSKLTLEGGAPIVDLAVLPDPVQDRLVVATRAREIMTIAWDSQHGFQPATAWHSATHGLRGRITALATFGHDRLAGCAAALTDGVRTRITFLRVDGHGILTTTNEFDYGRGVVRALSLARLQNKQGYQLLVGAGSDPHAALLFLDRELQRTEMRHPDRSAESRVAAVTFDGLPVPEYAVCAERMGLAWCVNLAEQIGHHRVLWTYEPDGSVEQIVPLALGRETCFALAAGRTVVVLRASDGRRIWGHRFPDIVRSIAFGRKSENRAELCISTDGGVVYVFSEMPAMLRARAHETVSGLVPALQKLATALRTELDRTEDELVWALAQLSVRRLPGEVLRDLTLPSARARLLRHVVEQNGFDLPELNRLAREDIVDRLTDDGEMALFLSYLPDGDQRWDAVLDKAFLDRRLTPARPEGRAARGRAFAAWLQRLGRRQVSVEHLLARRPADSDLDDRFLSAELARVLFQTLAREGRKPLIAAFLRVLLRFPTSVLRGARLVEGDGLPLGPLLQALATLESTSLCSVRTLAFARLTHLLNDAEPAPFIQAMVLVGEVLALPAPSMTTSWAQQRQHVLDTIRALDSLKPVLRDLQEHIPLELHPLIRFVIRKPIPQDQEPLVDRRHWLTEALGHAAPAIGPGGYSSIAAQPVAMTITPTSSPTDHANEALGWSHLVMRLTDDLVSVLRPILEAEGRFCESLIRPYVRVTDRDIRGNQVKLHLTVEGEGDRVLQRAQVKLDLRSAHGLDPLPGCDWRWERTYPEYRPGRPESLILGARLRSMIETELTVVAYLEAGGYVHRDLVRVPLMSVATTPLSQAPFPRRLATRFQQLCATLFKGDSGIVLAAIDWDLGRAAFVEKARKEYGATVCDLDSHFQNYGPDQRYGDLSGMRIADYILGRGETTDPDLTKSERDLSISEASDDLFQRLLGDHRLEGVLDDLFRRLTKHATEKKRPRVVLMTSASIASRLRTCLPSAFEVVRAYDLGASDERPSSPDVFSSDHEESSTELLAWLREATGIDITDANQVIAEIGADLRILKFWVDEAWRGNRRTPPRTVIADATTIRPMLLEDLHSLSPFELLVTTAGALASTIVPVDQVRPGHVPTADLAHSGSPKPLAVAGRSLELDAVKKLTFDRARSHVALEGLGRSSQNRSDKAPRLTKLVSEMLGMMRSEAREACFARLAKLGIGQYLGGVFRTGSAYKELLGLELDRLQASNASSQPPEALLLRAMTHPNRHPIECSSLADIAHLPEEHLDLLLPGALRKDRALLIRVARLWITNATRGDVSGVLRELFAPEVIKLLVAEGERPGPDGALRALAGSVERGPAGGPDLFGIGSLGKKGVYPRYVFWVPRHVFFSVPDLAREVDREDDLKESQVLILGPGAEHLAVDSQRRIVTLLSADLLAASTSASLSAGVHDRAKAKSRLTSFSPFITTGPVPPGSPIFVGRANELAFITSGIARHNILIVGCRKIGKTSLLYQVEHWAKLHSTYDVRFIDFQGMNTPDRVAEALSQGLGRQIRPMPAAQAIEETVAAMEETGRKMLFLLNEIDGLFRTPDFLARLRRLAEGDRARFVMVGYARAMEDLEDPEAAAFHFFQGPDYNGKALALSQLGVDPARQLLDLLEKPPLSLRWRSETEREDGYARIIKATYQIPPILQNACQSMVIRLENVLRTEIREEDVAHVVAEINDQIREQVAISKLTLRTDDTDGAEEGLLASGIELMIYMLVRWKYFKGESSPIHDQNLTAIDPNEFGFTEGDLREVALNTMNELLLPRESVESASFKRWLNQLPLRRILRRLTLTLHLQISRTDQTRFYFPLHMLPLELQRQHGKQDPTLDFLIVTTAHEFLRLLDSSKSGNRQLAPNTHTS